MIDSDSSGCLSCHACECVRMRVLATERERERQRACEEGSQTDGKGKRECQME